MVSGRKLLLADDSPTIQKVIDLTFSDEGLDVLTVGDGQQALEKLEEFAPDIVLADVFMPGMTGYELCEAIKRSSSFNHVPVMLLVGSFEPFDEAEARRVGADDYLTKPFQSIRTLIGKVRSLLTGGSAGSEEPTRQLAPPPEAEIEKRSSADFIERATADTAPLPNREMGETTLSNYGPEIPFADPGMDDEMIETTPVGSDEGGWQSVYAQQTGQYSAADLQETGIDQIDDSAPQLEPEPVGAMAAASAGDSQPRIVQSASMAPVRASSEDVLLDLDDYQISPVFAEADDFILDLNEDALDEAAALRGPTYQRAFAETIPPTAETSAKFASALASEPAVDELQATLPSFPRPTQQLPDESEMMSVPAREADDMFLDGHTDHVQPAAPRTGQITLSDLSPEVIDAIARRAVEHLSAPVVEQVAWEVVPPLAELMIKKRLEESGQ